MASTLAELAEAVGAPANRADRDHRRGLRRTPGDTEPLSDTVELCVFADRSAIDHFGIFYASDGTNRGVDLASVMRYQPDGDTPDVFATGS